MSIPNGILYTVTALIWGSTWFAIKHQAPLAPYEISIFYRFAPAALCLVSWCLYRGHSLKFTLKEHFFIALLGFSMFSIHYLFVYDAANYILSGMIALVFSGVSFLSVMNNALFFRVCPTFNVILGSLLGITGLLFVFWKDVVQMDTSNDTFKGITLAAIGTFIFSLGGSVGQRNNQSGLAMLPSTALGMVYGSLAILFSIFLHDVPFVFPKDPSYWVSLIYLTIFGSIVAFLSYLRLIKTMGPEKAGYLTVFFPVVALVISWLFEGYVWTFNDVVGLCLVIAGNILMVKKISFAGIGPVK